jgi:hypothetical protein
LEVLSSKFLAGVGRPVYIHFISVISLLANPKPPIPATPLLVKSLHLRFLFSTSCGYEISPARKIQLALHDLPEIFPYPIPLVISATFSNQLIYLKKN